MNPGTVLCVFICCATLAKGAPTQEVFPIVDLVSMIFLYREYLLIALDRVMPDMLPQRSM